MKKLLTLLLLFTAFASFGQFKIIKSPSFGYEVVDGKISLWNGTVWTKLASNSTVQHSIDSLGSLGYTKIQVNSLLTPYRLQSNHDSLSTLDEKSYNSLTDKPDLTLKVDKTTTVNGHTLSGNVTVTTTDLTLQNVTNTSDANKPVSTAQQTALNLKINSAEKGANNGVAMLDDNAKVPLSQMNDAIMGSVRYQGTWSAVNNIPAIPTASAANKGYYFVASDEATYAGTLFKVKDWIISNGTIWQKVDNNNLIGSVFGRVGNVLANSGDYTTDQVTEGTNKYYTEGRVSANASVVANSAKVTNANHTGDVSGSGVLTLATVNGAIGTYNNVTVNSKGLVTGASNAGYLTGITSGQVTTALGFTPYNATNPLGFTNNTGTVTSVAAGLGISGGTITTTGTHGIDTANVSILSRQRAANTYQAKGSYEPSFTILPSAQGGTGVGTLTGLAYGNGTAAFTAATAAQTAAVLGVTTTELSYLDPTSSIQTQLNGKSPLAGSASITAVGAIASGTWNGTDIAVASGGTGVGTLTGLAYGNSTAAFTAATAAQVAAVLGVTTTELSYLDPTSSIQTQLNAKSPLAGSASITTVGAITSGSWGGTIIPTTKGGTGGVAAPVLGGVIVGASSSAYGTTAAGTAKQVMTSNGGALPTWQTLDLTYLAGSSFKTAVKTATTANITLSAPQTIDGIACVAGDRILVWQQTLPAANGIYTVAAGAWTRTPDADSPTEISSALVAVDQGTLYGGYLFDNDFRSTYVVGTNAMPWNYIIDFGKAAISTTAIAASSVVGISPNYSRQDHVHQGVLNFAGGTTGLTPAAATAGSVTLGGILNPANGGTGVGTLTGLAYGNGVADFTAATGAQVAAVLGVTTAELAYLDPTSSIQTQLNAKAPSTTVSNATHTGDVTGSTALTLAAAGTAGTYTKVTTDSKGRVTSGTTLSSTDVVNALGYTPSNGSAAPDNHMAVYGTTDIVASGPMSLMANMTLNVTPKGDNYLILFTAPFWTSAFDQSVRLYLYCDGVVVNSTYTAITSNDQVVSFWYLGHNSTLSAKTFQLKWLASSAIQQRGMTDANRSLTYIDLP